MKEIKNVSKTVELDLCVSCGICKASCPKGAIDLVFSNGQYHPSISDECSNCGICISVCPGIEVNYNFLNNGIKKDYITGNVIKSYVCSAKDRYIRSISTSGGAVSVLIAALLKSGDYSGAFVLNYDGRDTSMAKLSYVNNQDEVIAAAKSKYIPASVENVIRNCTCKKDPVIVVGTPCQIYGIKKYFNYFGLNDSHVLYFGLFCDKVLNYNILQYYRDRFEGKNREIFKFNFRDKDNNEWPGDTKITFTNGEELTVNRNIRMALKKYFQLNRCLFCMDKLNKLADISFGDCYIPEKKSSLGNSNIIVRTEKGIDVIKNYSHILNIEEVNSLQIFLSQEIKKKKVNFLNAYLFAKKTGHCIYPNLTIKNLQIDTRIKIEYKIMREKLSYGKNLNNFNVINILLMYDNLRNISGHLVNKMIGAKQ